MINAHPDESPDVHDDAVEVEVQLEEPFVAEGPSCRISWEDGQLVIECATPEDAELAAELLTLAPVRVTTKTPLEGSSPSEGPPAATEQASQE